MPVESTNGHNGGVYDELGIADGYHDVSGRWHFTPQATRDALTTAMGEVRPGPPLWFVDEGSTAPLTGRCHLGLGDGHDLGAVDALPADLPLGYHRLTPVDGGPETMLVVAPRRCPRAPRGWGVAAQVYSLWRAGGWGIGDLGDVEHLGQEVAALGGAAVLLSPLHAPAPTMPQATSPYYPSSRLWLDPSLIPVQGEAPAGLPNEPGGLIDRDRVWGAKRQALATLFAAEGNEPEWRAWARAQGPALWQFATWNALADRFGPAWRLWPDEFRHPDSPAVLDLPLTDHQFASSCEFHAWVQWIADRALRRASAAAGVELIGDLAVGCSPDGADAWRFQDMMALDVQIGAPPDPFAAAGQAWGLPPFVPWRLSAARYGPFIEMVRATCRGMGGVRIDHVMGMFRQFWIPAGGSPAEGAYVRMPADELMAIIRLEATVAGCFVVGEDLGTVEPEVHEAMSRGGLLGTKVWWFDQAIERWPEDCLATVTTHDLPTVAGVVGGTDGDDAMREAVHATCPGLDIVEVAIELHRRIASSPAALCLATLEDLAGLDERPNYPGTVTPRNWSHRMPAACETILNDEPAHSVVAAMGEARLAWSGHGREQR